MVIIGVDYHPSDQYIAFADTDTWRKAGHNALQISGTRFLGRNSDF
jgi:hypothetical protein